MKKIKNIIIIGGILLALFLLRGVFFKSNNNIIANTTSYITKPVGTFFAGLGWWFRDKTKIFFEIGTLKKDNQKFFDDNLKLMAEIAKLKETKKENDNLRRELKLMPKNKYRLEAAMVIGRESGTYSEIIYINKGQSKGIDLGQAVLVGEGILIGRVIEVNTNTAKIRLITDKNFKVNAKLIETDGKGIVFGQYGTSAIMKMIPQTIKINKGDSIVTSELSEGLQKDLLIGYTQDVVTTADGLFQEVTIFLPRDLENLHLVQILLE
jgi:rod shape-determining protein MreC